MIGQTISHYKILAKLGEGGMGVVYKAEDIKLGRYVALKFLPHDLTRDPIAKERFINEAKAASALDHPNICTIYEIGESEEGQLFIAMAYYEGETLREKVASGPLSVTSVIEIATQIASGLARAHEAGIIHRDIKSANIMITKRGEVKILDFGLAKLAGQPHLTKSGATMGTIAYMSPEQTQGLLVDHRTDIWSLGVVMYEMLTGQLPFKGEYDQAMMYTIVNTDAKSIRNLRSEVSSRLEAIVNKALAKKLDERYQEAVELLEDLKSPTKKMASNPSVSAGKLDIKKKRFLYGSLLVLIIAMIGAGIYFFPKPTQTINSIAVLPLQNLSGDPEQEYFAEGMTEALIANLAKIKSLRVISRTSVMQFKNKRESLSEIAKELNVDAVVEGSVARSGDRVRITAQLIEAQTDRHLWADSYVRNLRDVLALQSEVTEAIVRELRVKLTSQEKQRLVNAHPINSEAYQLYLRGLNKSHNYLDFEKAIACYQQAINLEPTFAHAYAALATSYLGMRFVSAGSIQQEIFVRAKAAAIKAQELDDAIGEVCAALGDIKFYYEWNWHDPEQDFNRAIELEPQNADILRSYAAYLVLSGQSDKGITLHKKAIELDPLSAIYSITLGWALFYAHRYDEGIAHLRRMLIMYPNQSQGINYQIAWNYVMKGMYQEAITSGETAGSQKTLAYIYAVSGRRNDALKILKKLLEASQSEYLEPFWIAIIYTGLNDKEQAFYWLSKAFHDHSVFMVWIKTEPALDPLRSDPRFEELCIKVGLPSARTISSKGR